MHCKKYLLSLSLALVSFVSRPAQAIEPLTLLGCAAGGACVYAACKLLLKGNHKEVVEQNLTLKTREAILREYSRQMNEQEFGSDIQLKVIANQKLYSHIEPSTTEKGRRTKSMAKSLGSEAALHHLDNLLRLEESSASLVMAVVNDRDPRTRPRGPLEPAFDLIPENWPLMVVPQGPDGGKFADDMKLGLYLHNQDARIILGFESLVYLNDFLDKSWANYDLLSERLSDWQTELQQLYFIDVQFGISKARNSMLNSRGPFGQFRTGYAVLEVQGAKDEAQEMQAYLFLLRKVAAFGRSENLIGHPGFKDFYRP